jgi:hypothetical protein
MSENTNKNEKKTAEKKPKKKAANGNNAIALRIQKHLDRLTTSIKNTDMEIKKASDHLARVPRIQARLEKAKKRKIELTEKLEAEKKAIEGLVKAVNHNAASA